MFRSGVATANSQNLIPAAVKNNSNQPIELFFAGTRIGKISSAQVCDQSANINTLLENPSCPPIPPTKCPIAVNLNDCEVSPSEKKALATLLNDYRDAFANSDAEVGRTNRAQVDLHTKTKVPVAMKLHRTPFSLR